MQSLFLSEQLSWPGIVNATASLVLWVLKWKCCNQGDEIAFSHPMLLCLLVSLKFQQNWVGICCWFYPKFSALLTVCSWYSELFVPQQQLEVLKSLRRISSILFIVKTSLQQSKVVFELKWGTSDPPSSPCTHVCPATWGKNQGIISSLLEVFFLTLVKVELLQQAPRNTPQINSNMFQSVKSSG